MATARRQQRSLGAFASRAARVVIRLSWRLVRGVLVVAAATVAPFALPPPPPPPRPAPEQNDGGQEDKKR